MGSVTGSQNGTISIKGDVGGPVTISGEVTCGDESYPMYSDCVTINSINTILGVDVKE